MGVGIVSSATETSTSCSMTLVIDDWSAGLWISWVVTSSVQPMRRRLSKSAQAMFRILSPSRLLLINVSRKSYILPSRKPFMRYLIPLVIGLVLFLAACSESQNCDELEDSFIFGKDDCWADQAKDAKDPSICANKVSGSINKFTCFAAVASAAGDVTMCAKYLPEANEHDVCVIAVAKAKGDVNICAQSLKDKKGRMDQCARDVNGAKVSAKVEACKKQSQPDLCIINVAKEFKDGNICVFTSLESKGICAVSVADELGNTKPILDNFVAGDERDLLLATYTIASLNDDGLKLIQNPRTYDGALIMVNIVAYVEEKVVAPPAYCDHLKGGYEGEYADADFTINKNLCEGIVAAFNELKDGGDACNAMLPARITDEDDLASAKEHCASFVSKIRSVEKKVAEANTPEEYQALLKSLVKDLEESG